MKLIRIITLAILCATWLAVAPSPASAQKRPATMREFLLQYRGKEINIVDRTGGNEQFVSGNAAKAYVLILVDVGTDHFIVSRDSATDKRTFLYPISLIRRIIYLYDGKPYDRIVLEMY
jgi:hypothetical protein